MLPANLSLPSNTIVEQESAELDRIVQALLAEAAPNAERATRDYRTFEQEFRSQPHESQLSLEMSITRYIADRLTRPRSTSKHTNLKPLAASSAKTLLGRLLSAAPDNSLARSTTIRRLFKALQQRKAQAGKARHAKDFSSFSESTQVAVRIVLKHGPSHVASQQSAFLEIAGARNADVNRIAQPNFEVSRDIANLPVHPEAPPVGKLTVEWTFTKSIRTYEDRQTIEYPIRHPILLQALEAAKLSPNLHPFHLSTQQMNRVIQKIAPGHTTEPTSSAALLYTRFRVNQ